MRSEDKREVKVVKLLDRKLIEQGANLIQRIWELAKNEAENDHQLFAAADQFLLNIISILVKMHFETKARICQSAKDAGKIELLFLEKRVEE